MLSLIFQTICDSKEKRRYLRLNPKIKRRIQGMLAVKFYILNLEWRLLIFGIIYHL
jgi:hypothetical protein